jgi:hypothetical protein
LWEIRQQGRWQGLPEADAAVIEQYLADIERRIRLSPKETAAIVEDMARLIRFYLAEGLTAQAATVRIGGDILGDFYTEAAPEEWYPLDSAAKVYPLMLTHASMSVFRVSAYLCRPVVPCVLQVALLSTVKRFPLFATTVRKGFFWHYIDATRGRFTVKKEDNLPCVPIDVSGARALSFRLQYYERRISLEAFHILTDGTGALTFLKTLVREYLRLLGREIPYDTDVLSVSEAPDGAELQNDFPLADKADKEGFWARPAAQIRGWRTGIQPARVLHFLMSSGKLRAVSKAHGTTVTGFLAAALFVAAAAALRRPGPKRRLHIQIPVNMRQFYPSKSLRNFSMYSILQCTYDEITDLKAVIPIVKARLRAGTGKEAMDRMMNLTNALVAHPILCFLPLMVKRPVFRRIVSFFDARALTATLSNLGMVRTDFGGEVDFFEMVLCANRIHGACCAMVGYGDKNVLSITKSTLEDTLERKMYEILVENGIDVDIEGVSL